MLSPSIATALLALVVAVPVALPVAPQVAPPAAPPVAPPATTTATPPTAPPASAPTPPPGLRPIAPPSARPGTPVAPAGPLAPTAPGAPAAPAAPGAPQRQSPTLRALPYKPVAFERFALPNGIRVAALQVPNSPMETILTFLPLTLVGDGPGQSQWAQLAEQVMIRSVDLQGSESNFIRFRGDTRAGSMHLETIGPANSLQAMAAKHAKWLATAEVSPEVLEQAKKMVAADAATLAGMGTTTKFAISAWNQVVRQGKQSATVLGDLQSATPESVAAYLKSNLPIGKELFVAVIGPAPVDAVRTALESTLGALPRREAAPTASPVLVATAPGQELRATWDLPTRHMVLWWPLTAEQVEGLDQRAHFEGMAAAFRSAIMFSQPLKGGGRPLPMVEAPLPPAIEGSVATLLVDIPLGTGTAEPESLRTEVETALKMVADPKFGMTDYQPRLIIPYMLMSPPPFNDKQRAGMKAKGDTLEPQWLQATATAEYELGSTRDQIAAALDASKLARVQALAKALSEIQPRVLILEQTAP